jgi:hypothetical protein
VIAMKKKALAKEFFMSIKKTYNRFISICLIVMLGTAFFAGVKAAEPDMQESADIFFDDSKLMDIRVMSTLGLTEDDVVYVVDKETNGVEFTILKGKLPTGFEGCTAKNLSKEIDDEFYQFRREGNVFTQPQAGSFTIGIKDKINESYFSFKDFLNKSTI